MPSIHEHWTEPGTRDDPSASAEATTLDLGQRRAARWRRLEPSVARHVTRHVLVGVVHTTDSIRFIAVARDDEALLRELASYVATNASDRLWMADAARVQSLLATRDFEAAVRAYFTAADTPWDRDWLVIEAIH